MILILIKIVAYDILSRVVKNGQKGEIFFVKFSTTARYSLRAMSDLCLHSKNFEPVSVSDIASRQNIPVNYLEQLFGKLRRGGLLESVRGAQGGYFLARPATEINIAEILETLGEPVIFGMCQTEKGCENSSTCPTFKLWRKVKGSVDEILEQTSLEDIAYRKISLPDDEDFDTDNDKGGN